MLPFFNLLDVESWYRISVFTLGGFHDLLRVPQQNRILQLTFEPRRGSDDDEADAGQLLCSDFYNVKVDIQTVSATTAFRQNIALSRKIGSHANRILNLAAYHPVLFTGAAGSCYWV